MGQQAARQQPVNNDNADDLRRCATLTRACLLTIRRTINPISNKPITPAMVKLIGPSGSPLAKPV